MQPADEIPPPGARGVSSEVTSLFTSALVGGQLQLRPTASQWREALESLWRRVRRCDSDSGHMFFSGLANCPWCEFASRKQGAFDPFASVAIKQWLDASVETFAQKAAQLRQRIERLRAPLPTARVPMLTATHRPVPRDVEEAFVKLKTASTLPFTLRSIWYIKEVQAIRSEVKSRRRVLDCTKKKMESLCSEYERRRVCANSVAGGPCAKVEAMLQTLSEIPEELRRELAERQAHARQEELHEFLRGHLVADAQRELNLREAVWGLEQANITTAADIDRATGPYYWTTYQGRRQKIKVARVGRVRWNRLLDWRRRLEQSFRPRGKLPDAVLADMKKQAMEKGLDLGRRVSRLIEHGEADRREFEGQLIGIQQKIEYAAADVAEAEADWAFVAGLEGI